MSRSQQARELLQLVELSFYMLVITAVGSLAGAIFLYKPTPSFGLNVLLWLLAIVSACLSLVIASLKASRLKRLENRRAKVLEDLFFVVGGIYCGVLFAITAQASWQPDSDTEPAWRWFFSAGAGISLIFVAWGLINFGANLRTIWQRRPS